MDPLEIRCNCGTVRIRLTAPPVQQFYCHCDDCQRATGSPYSMISLFPTSAVEVEGPTDVWTLGTLPRYRCRMCGTQLFGIPGDELIGIRGERLAAGQFAPQFHIHCRYAHLPVNDSLPHYANLPKELGGSDERVAW